MKKKLLSLCILLIMLMMPMVANAAIGTLYTDAKSLNVGARFITSYLPLILSNSSEPSNVWQE